MTGFSNHTMAWLVLFALSVAYPAPLPARTIPVDGVAARVNDQVITVSDVLAALQPVDRQLRQAYQGAELDRKLEEAYDKAVDALIDRELILDYFNQQKDIALPDNIVESRMEEIIRTKFGNNRAAFRKALDEEGATLEEWRANLRKSMIISFLREREVDSKVSVPPQAVRDAYEKAADTFRVPEQVRLWMIALRDGATDEEKALKRKQAEDVRRRLLAGEPFEALARQVSEGVYAKNGGDCGFIDPATRRPELAKAILDLPLDEISPVIPAGEDLYILKVSKRNSASVIPFEKVQDTLRSELEKQESRRLYDAWMARLKKKVLIRKY